MKRLTFLFIVFCIPCCTVLSQSNLSNPFDIEFKKISDDIYVAYRPDPVRVPVEGNVTIIINDRDVVVVDGSGAPYSARKIIEGIKALTPNPVRYLINTHGHGDHTVGNQEYVRTYPGVEIVARPETRGYLVNGGINYVSDLANNPESRKEEIAELIRSLRSRQLPGYEKVIAFWQRYLDHDLDIRAREYTGVSIFPPTMIIDKKLRLHRGKRTIEVLFLGHGKTASDVVIFLPAERILVSGDIVTEPIPYGFSRQPSEWLATMERMAKMDFDILVTGHGDVQYGKDFLNAVIRLVRSTVTQVKSAIDQGLDFEGTRKLVDLVDFERRFAGNDAVLRDLWIRWFLNPGVERTYNELKKIDGK